MITTKESSKLRIIVSFCGEYTDDRQLPAPKANKAESIFMSQGHNVCHYVVSAEHHKTYMNGKRVFYPAVLIYNHHYGDDN